MQVRSSKLDRALARVRRSDKVVGAVADLMSGAGCDLSRLPPLAAAPKRNVRTIGDQSCRVSSLSSTQQTLTKQIIPAVSEAGIMVSKVEKMIRRTFMPVLMKLPHKILNELGAAIETGTSPSPLTVTRVRSMLILSATKIRALGWVP